MPAMPRHTAMMTPRDGQIRRLLRSFVFFFSRTKRTVRFLCPFSNCCRSLPRSHREWMRVVDGEATDCLRSVLLARERDPAAVPFFPLSALAHSRRTRPRPLLCLPVRSPSRSPPRGGDDSLQRFGELIGKSHLRREVCCHKKILNSI